jgi:UDP-N-acetylmuramoylalanine--D-glutamate ligase
VLIEKVDDIPEDAIVVLELSSFQLQMCDVSPDVSLLLNIRPNHLDIHADFEEYVNSKKNIFRFQNCEDWVFLNHDEQLVRNMAGECPGNLGFFSLIPPDDHHIDYSGIPWAFLDGENLIYVTETGQTTCVAKKSDILIPGQHNISNVLGATLLSMRLGATAKGVRDAISAFHGLEHRIEYVCEKDGVRFYNDSIATSPDRTIALIQSMPGPLVLILGGYDKGLSFDELGERIVDAHAKVILLGACAEKIEESIKKAAAREERAWHEVLKVVRAKDLEEAVRLASSLASPGDSVVLSPACASYDMFRNFEERGRLFKDLVRSLCL